VSFFNSWEKVLLLLIRLYIVQKHFNRELFNEPTEAFHHKLDHDFLSGLSSALTNLVIKRVVFELESGVNHLHDQVFFGAVFLDHGVVPDAEACAPRGHVDDLAFAADVSNQGSDRVLVPGLLHRVDQHAFLVHSASPTVPVWTPESLDDILHLLSAIVPAEMM